MQCVFVDPDIRELYVIASAPNDPKWYWAIRGRRYPRSSYVLQLPPSPKIHYFFALQLVHLAWNLYFYKQKLHFKDIRFLISKLLHFTVCTTVCNCECTKWPQMILSNKGWKVPQILICVATTPKSQTSLLFCSTTCTYCMKPILLQTKAAL